MNPLLADNMGRWAEVYFTAAPEKREEAVLELLRELEAKNGGGERPSKTEVTAAPRAGESSRESEEALAATNSTLTHCQACGHDNPPSHQFCGMCGIQLTETLSTEAGGVEAASSLPENPPTRSDSPTAESNSESSAVDRYAEPTGPPDQSVVGEPARDINDFSLFRRVSEKSPLADEDWPSEPSGLRRYRVHIGVAVAIVILTLGYIAWRGTQPAQSNRQVSLPQPAAPAEARPPAAPSASTSQPTPQSPDTPVSAAANASSTNGDVARNEAARQTSGGHVHEVSASATRPQANADTSPGAVTGGGNEELAIAQRYLSGGDGQARNSAEAAQWLWKSVAKHNSQATLILADLYLKGDGVSKNCDQARVLLDSAAQKGVSAAADRLRHLEAFGCE